MLSQDTFRYALVARETVKLYHEMVESEGWGDMARIDLNPFNRYMAKVCIPLRYVFTMLIRCSSPWE